MASTEAREIRETTFGPGWLSAQADPESCGTCGEPFSAPECAACFDARWTRENDDPSAKLAGARR